VGKRVIGREGGQATPGALALRVDKPFVRVDKSLLGPMSHMSHNWRGVFM
jgi:hypothetical protein